MLVRRLGPSSATVVLLPRLPPRCRGRGGGGGGGAAACSRLARRDGVVEAVGVAVAVVVVISTLETLGGLPLPPMDLGSLLRTEGFLAGGGAGGKSLGVSGFCGSCAVGGGSAGLGPPTASAILVV